MDDNFSPRVKDVIAYSKEEALRLGHDFIGTEHLMLGILRDGNGKAIQILNNLNVDLDHLRRKVEILSPASPSLEVNVEKKNLHLTRQAERALKTTFLEAKVFQSSSISTAHLLLCILRNENDPTTKLLNKLKIDYEAASEWLDEYEKVKINKINMDSENNKEERIKRAIETTEDLKYLALLINQEKAYYSFSGYGHRFYNPITNLKSELRKFLTYDGQPLIEIDVKNSQPFLIPNLFVPSFWENSRNSGEKLRLKDIDKELNRIINNNNKLKDIVTFLKTPESLDQQEFEFKKITDLVMTAQFYEYIQLHFESLYPERFNNRKNVKKEVMRIFYAENIDVHKPFYKPSKTFQSHFPYVFELLRLIKEIEYTFLPIILQRIESYLLLDVICKKISERDSGILTLTIHDSIITTKGNESIVEEIILHEIESWTGYKPRLEMEDLLPLKMAA